MVLNILISKEVILPLMVDFMDAMVAVLVVSCRAVPTTTGVVVRPPVTAATARIPSQCLTANGTPASVTASAVLCLLGLSARQLQLSMILR